MSVPSPLFPAGRHVANIYGDFRHTGVKAPFVVKACVTRYACNMLIEEIPNV